MTAPSPILSAPDDLGRIYDAVADTIAMAGGYVEIAAQAAQLRDPRVLAYGIRCASVALITAAEMRPVLRNGGRRA